MDLAQRTVDERVLRPARWAAALVLLSFAGCVQPATEEPPTQALSEGSVAVTEPLPEEVERRRARARARAREQFEAAARGEKHRVSGAHSLFNCPHCVDPFTGLIPDEALIDGPMPVWN